MSERVVPMGGLYYMGERVVWVCINESTYF